MIDPSYDLARTLFDDEATGNRAGRTEPV